MEKSLLDLIKEIKRGCLEDEKHIRMICQVSLAEYNGIVEIDVKEQITCNTLSQKMGLSPSRGSRVIDGLVRKGYFLRTIHPGDRRSLFISLSADGQKIKQQIEQEKQRCEEKIRKRFSEKEMNQVKEALDLIAQIFE